MRHNEVITELSVNDFKYRTFKYDDCFGVQQYAEIYSDKLNKWIGKVYDFRPHKIIQRVKLLNQYINEGIIK